jgi:hypothetical protein
MHRARTGLAALVSSSASTLTPAQVADLTRYLERRLTDIDGEGDCAYERAMGQFYLQLIQELRGTAPRADL